MVSRGDSSPSHEAKYFKTLVATMGKNPPNKTQSCFVKRLDVILEVEFPPVDPKRVVLAMEERALVGQFTGL